MAITLESIRTGRENKPPRIVFYGPMGIGKTTWAAAAPNPFFVQCEDGAGKLEYARADRAETFNDVMENFSFLYKEEHPFDTVVLDTLSSLEQLVHSEIRKEKGDDIFASFGRGNKLAEAYFERVMKALNALRDKKGMMVVILAHTKVDRFEPPDVEPYDRYTLNCHEKIQDMVFQWCDAMLIGTYKVYVQTDDLGFNQKRGRGLGDGKRTLYTEERPAHLAKNRWDLPYEMKFDKPFDWDTLLKYTGWKPGKRKEEQVVSEA